MYRTLLAWLLGNDTYYMLLKIHLSSYHFKAEMKPWNNVESSERGSRQGMAACMERAARTFLGNYFFTLMDALAR